MPFYSVTFHGTNYRLGANGGKAYGFYTTRFVEAPNADAADDAAAALIFDDPLFEDLVNAADDPAHLETDEIAEFEANDYD